MGAMWNHLVKLIADVRSFRLAMGMAVAGAMVLIGCTQDNPPPAPATLPAPTTQVPVPHLEISLKDVPVYSPSAGKVNIQVLVTWYGSKDEFIPNLFRSKKSNDRKWILGGLYACKHLSDGLNGQPLPPGLKIWGIDPDFAAAHKPWIVFYDPKLTEVDVEHHALRNDMKSGKIYSPETGMEPADPTPGITYHWQSLTPESLDQFYEKLDQAYHVEKMFSDKLGVQPEQKNQNQVELTPRNEPAGSVPATLPATAAELSK